MDTRSLNTLAGVDPGLSKLVKAAASSLEAQGTFLCVYQGLRTAAQQNALYAQGRTTVGHIVTNAQAGKSNHNYGLAVDVVPYLSGSTGGLNWNVSTAQYKAMIEALKAQGLVYGGDWIHFPDNDHFQMASIPNSPSELMISDYTSMIGGTMELQDIWNRAAAGVYV
jgi:peptidoglycan L-alanyl-D-glutamate endopeptidase CwlK